jgi:hypothetical protein
VPTEWPPPQPCTGLSAPSILFSPTKVVQPPLFPLLLPVLNQEEEEEEEEICEAAAGALTTKAAVVQITYPTLAR